MIDHMTSVSAQPGPPGPGRVARGVARLPPTSFFAASAVFHYLGPSLAVLLFVHVHALGVAWLRIAAAAAFFALWRRPWRIWRAASPARRRVFLALGVVLAAMNSLFYLAVDRLPLSTVGAIEFLGTVILAALGARTRRNLLALLLAVGGVAVLTDVRLSGQPLGFVFAFANCAGFMLYVILGHRIANAPLANAPPANAPPAGLPAPDGPPAPAGDAGPRASATSASATSAAPMSGIDQLGMSMLIAAVVATPVGLGPAVVAFTHPLWLAWGVGVGLCSSVIPYVTDQLAMARLNRSTFALMLALLPAVATIIGFLVLGQTPTGPDLAGIALVIAGVALHREQPAISARGPARPARAGPRRTAAPARRGGWPRRGGAS
jgi:inner membrane transporter RhtA